MKTLFAFLLVCTLLVAGCSKSSKTYTTTNADGKKITLASKGNEVSMEAVSNSGEKTSLKASASGVALPADFSKDIPIHPKGVVQVYNVMGQNLQIGVLIPVAAADVTAYYEAELKKQGWTCDPATKMGEGAMLHPKKDQRGGMVTITPQDAKNTYVQMMRSR